MPVFRNFVLALAVFLSLAGGRVAANGWEHGAVPFSALVGALSDEDPGLRYRAAQSLGYRGEKRAVAPLLAALRRKGEDATVRAAIIIALGRLGDSAAVPTLRTCLASEEIEELRADCAEALGRIGDPAMLPDLLATFAGDPSFLVRSTIVDALGGFSDGRAVKLLAQLAGDRRNQSLARRAVVALGRTGSPDAVPPLLRLLATTRSTPQRLAIVEALGRLKADAARAPLAAIADAPGDPRLRTAAVIALGEIRDGESLPVLLQLLDDPVAAIRLTAIRALAALGDRRANRAIADLVEREARRLSGLDNTALLADPAAVLTSLSLQLEGLRAIVELDPSAALDAILAAARRRSLARDSAISLRLAEGFYEVRRLALFVLGYSGAERARTFLAGAEGLGDPDPRIRMVAVRSLGVLGGAGLVQRLAPFLADSSADVRRMAAIVCGRLSDASAIPLLAAALKDRNALVRREAALGLAYLKARSEIAALDRLAGSDPDGNVRAAARFALRQLGAEPSTGQPLDRPDEGDGDQQ